MARGILRVMANQASGSNEAWGTLEELLLAGAIKRHGTSDWNTISAEVASRVKNISSHSPSVYSPEACKARHNIMQGRYNATASRGDIDGGSNGSLLWFEDLRKERVAQLKRELERSEDSIGSLQSKIKRMKVERELAPTDPVGQLKTIHKDVAPSIRHSNSPSIKVSEIQADMPEKDTAVGAVEPQEECRSPVTVNPRLPPGMAHPPPVTIEDQGHALEAQCVSAKSPPASNKPQSVAASDKVTAVVDGGQMPVFEDEVIVPETPPGSPLAGDFDFMGASKAHTSRLAEPSSAVAAVSASVRRVDDTSADVERLLDPAEGEKDKAFVAGDGEQLAAESERQNEGCPQYDVESAESPPRTDVPRVEAEPSGTSIEAPDVANLAMVPVVPGHGGLAGGLAKGAEMFSAALKAREATDIAVLDPGHRCTGAPGGGRVGAVDEGLLGAIDGVRKVGEKLGPSGGNKVEDMLTVKLMGVSVVQAEIARSPPGEGGKVEEEEEVREGAEVMPERDTAEDVGFEREGPLHGQMEPGVREGESGGGAIAEVNISRLPELMHYGPLLGTDRVGVSEVGVGHLGATDMLRVEEGLERNRVGGAPGEGQEGDGVGGAQLCSEVSLKSDEEETRATDGGREVGESDGHQDVLSSEVVGEIAAGVRCEEEEQRGVAGGSVEGVAVLDQVRDGGDLEDVAGRLSGGSVVREDEGVKHALEVEGPCALLERRESLDGDAVQVEDGAHVAPECRELSDLDESAMDVEVKAELAESAMDAEVKVQELSRTDEAFFADVDSMPAEPSPMSDSEASPIEVNFAAGGSALLASSEDVQLSVQEEDSTMHGKRSLPEEAELRPGQKTELRSEERGEGGDPSSPAMQIEHVPQQELPKEVEGKPDPEQGKDEDVDLKAASSVGDEGVAHRKQEAEESDELKLPNVEERGKAVEETGEGRTHESVHSQLSGKGHLPHVDVGKFYETGSPAEDETSPSSRRARREPKIPGRLAPLHDALQVISRHRFAHFFRHGVDAKDFPDYHLVVKQHMDLSIIRKALEDGDYSDSNAFFRDLLLMFHNALVFFRPGSAHFNAALVLRAEAKIQIERVREKAALLKQDRPATRRRAPPPASNSAAVASPSNSPAGPSEDLDLRPLEGENAQDTTQPSGSRKERKGDPKVDPPTTAANLAFPLASLTEAQPLAAGQAGVRVGVKRGGRQRKNKNNNNNNKGRKCRRKTEDGSLPVPTTLSESGVLAVPHPPASELPEIKPVRLKGRPRKRGRPGRKPKAKEKGDEAMTVKQEARDADHGAGTERIKPEGVSADKGQDKAPRKGLKRGRKPKAKPPEASSEPVPSQAVEEERVGEGRTEKQRNRPRGSVRGVKTGRSLERKRKQNANHTSKTSADVDKTTLHGNLVSADRAVEAVVRPSRVGRKAVAQSVVVAPAIAAAGMQATEGGQPKSVSKSKSATASDSVESVGLAPVPVPVPVPVPIPETGRNRRQR